MTKQCSKCGKAKTLDEFYLNSQRKDGRDAHCRVCEKEACRKRYAANPEKLRENYRRWRKANPDAAKESYRQWLDANREEERERRRQWKKDNPEKVRDCGRRCSIRRQNENYSKLAGMFGPACLDCKREYPMQIFHYHHTKPTSKNGMMNVSNWSWNRVKAYVENDVVQLCPTCHSLRHLADRELRRKEWGNL